MATGTAGRDCDGSFLSDLEIRSAERYETLDEAQTVKCRSGLHLWVSAKFGIEAGEQAGEVGLWFVPFGCKACHIAEWRLGPPPIGFNLTSNRPANNINLSPGPWGAIYIQAPAKRCQAVLGDMECILRASHESPNHLDAAIGSWNESLVRS